jgi:hypothetical protein
MTNPWFDEELQRWYYAVDLMVRGGFADKQEAAREMQFELTQIALRRKK